MTTLLIAGATGLVGGHALRLAMADPRVTRIVAPTRRALPPHAARDGLAIDNPIIDLARLPADAPWWSVDAVACALGTTIRDAGSPAAFRAVDVDAVVAFATHARAHGARAFALVSSIGADAAARALYLRSKGEAEDAVRAIGYPSVALLRPSIIGGERARPRAMERLLMRAVRAAAPIVPRRYRVVEAETIARALLDAALAPAPGVRVIDSDDIGRA